MPPRQRSRRNGRRPIKQEGFRPEPGRLPSSAGESTPPGNLSSVVGRIFGASTGIGTFVGAVAYGVLWNAYARFYSAFGLTPEEVGLSQERLILPAAVTGALLVLFLSLLALCGMAGYRMMPRGLVITRTKFLPLLVLLSLSSSLGALVLISSELSIWIFLVAGTAAVALATGAAFAISFWNEAKFWKKWLPSSVLVIFLLLAIDVATTRRHDLSELFAATLCLLGAAGFVYLMTSGRNIWSYTPQLDGTDHPSPLDGRVEPSPARAVLPMAILAAVVLLWGFERSVSWSNGQYEAGVRAVEIGYRDSRSSWVEPTIRPVIVQLIDPKRDPIAVCGNKPTYAASLIARDSDGWWVLLRATQEPKGYYKASVVRLSKEAYSIDLAPMVHQPAQPPSPDSGTPSWQTPACRR